MRRRASVAGAFYPSDPADLRATLARLMPAPGSTPALATLAPHAGYPWSGRVAGAVYGSIEVPPTVVLACFNHRGAGPSVAVWPEGSWETPLGDVPVDAALAEELLELPGTSPETDCFLREHSGEVQLPFLLHRRPDLRIVPVSLQSRDPEEVEGFACALASRLAGRPVLLAATTDLTHCGEGYGAPPPGGLSPRDFARRQDAPVLERIAALDFDGFWDTIDRLAVTMCGVDPTALLIAYAAARGATSARVLAYATSADDEPGADRAVGYPGVVVPSPKS